MIIDNLNCTFLKKQDDSFLKEKSAFQNRKTMKKETNNFNGLMPYFMEIK